MFTLKIKILISAILCCLLFTACKKYPKNTIWCKRPEIVIDRINGNTWKLVYYSVNDIDSTNAEFLRSWKELGISIDGKSDNINRRFSCYKILDGFYYFSNRKKELGFRWGTSDWTNTGTYSNPDYPNQRNIFLEKDLKWKIDMLTKSEFRIITEYHNYKYEIHFK